MLVASNTLLITDLSPSDFSPDALALLKTRLDSFGELKYLVPFKALKRLVVVYSSTIEAIAAKEGLSNVSVYFGQQTSSESVDYLKVPEVEKNFLLSPPGSPPIDWVQIRESNPYKFSHALEDIEALDLDNETLQESNNNCGGSRIVLNFNNPNPETPNGSSWSSLPTIIVDNYDGEDLQENWMGGGQLKSKKGAVFQQTRMPDYT
jgi:hypothetical protein